MPLQLGWNSGEFRVWNRTAERESHSVCVSFTQFVLSNKCLTNDYFFSKKSFVKCKIRNKMATKEQLQDMVEALTTLNIRHLGEEDRSEAEYLVNDIIISIEELMDFF